MTKFNLKITNFENTIFEENKYSPSVGDSFIVQEIYDENYNFKLLKKEIYCDISNSMEDRTYFGWRYSWDLSIKDNLHESINGFSRISWTTQSQFESENKSLINDFIIASSKLMGVYANSENIHVIDNYDKYLRPKTLEEFYEKCAEEGHYLPLYELIRDSGNYEVEDLQTLENGQMTLGTIIQVKIFTNKLKERTEKRQEKIVFEDFIAELFDDSIRDFFPNIDELYHKINIHKLPRKLTKNTKKLIRYWLKWKQKNLVT